jgi:16S rRNA (uracil1498-N3)-methyltransferase
MPRFYCPQPLVPGAIVDLPEAVAHHLHVVRQQPGDEVVLFNGEGGQARARLREIGKKRASATSSRSRPSRSSCPIPSPWPRACPRAARWTGSSRRRSNWAWRDPAAGGGALGGQAVGRTRRQAPGALGGVIVSRVRAVRAQPAGAVAPLQDFGRWIARRRWPAHSAVAARDTVAGRLGARHTAAAVTLLIGPEGGFSAQEEETALAQGALALSMGPRVLRTETAGLAALATSLNAVWSAE